MEALGYYLFRSAVWISGFALVYILFLRNERFFLLNRIYLITGILASVILPMVTIRYFVEAPVIQAEAAAGALTMAMPDGYTWQHYIAIALYAVWLAGVVFILLRYVVQILPVLRAAGKADMTSGYPVKVLRSSEYPGSFSLFSFVIVNPSVSDREAREIMNHEMVHIRQMHSFDLVLSSVLCAVQWFNPVAWYYSRFIRQNHEYLADEEALQLTSDPAVYRAVLLNQIAGSPVIDLGNSFNYSLNKKRFLMMKNTIRSPYRKLRLLLILPVAALVLYAFAEPQYRVASAGDGQTASDAVTAAITKNVSGVVKAEDGSPLEGAVVVVKGTTMGTTTEASGRFTLKNVPDDAELVITYVGFETKVVSVKAAGTEINAVMRRGEVITDTVNIAPPPPPPPPPPPSLQSKALVVLDGKITGKPFSDIPPETIKEVNILKGEMAVAKYGEKGREGVIEIHTWENVTGRNPQSEEVKVTGYGKGEKDDVFVVVEEMPRFPGGEEAMIQWIGQNLKYPEEARKNGVTGFVSVGFIVTKTGKVADVKIEKSASPLLNEEAVRVIKQMPDWTPGSQKGKKVDVKLVVPVKFNLH
jgi:TonB family protein